jgi:uncharacterized protein YbjT (DUF2867 family)
LLGNNYKKSWFTGRVFKVDFQYGLNLAIETNKKGASNFYLISSLGANENSKIFYNSVKGKLENAIINIGFKSCYIFRPSLLFI